MYAPNFADEEDVIPAAPLEKEEAPLLADDPGDMIHMVAAAEELADFDRSTGMPKFYHADDSAISHLPKARSASSSAAAKLAMASAIGGTMALLGVGGYVVGRALQKRKPVKPSEPFEPAQAEAAVSEVLAAMESPDNVPNNDHVKAAEEAPARQFAFDWRPRYSGE